MFEINPEFKFYVRTFMRLIYPAQCTACRLPLFVHEKYLCDSCESKILNAPSPSCVKCAEFLPPYGSIQTVCTKCKSQNPRFDFGLSLSSYEEPVNQILHQIKYGQKPWLIQIFRKSFKTLAATISKRRYDFIVPVPIDSRRKQERGFNQAHVISQIISEKVIGKARVQNLLKKNKSTLPQSILSRANRLTNLQGAFSVRNQRAVKNKTILLVDDVVTTGSTLSECARVLKNCGAARVDFVTLARAR